MEKLEHLHKIQLATSAIDYMSTKIQLSMMSFAGSSYGELAKRHAEKLEEITEQLKPILNNLGDFLNNHDMTDSLDERITEPAYDILIHGNDTAE
ncbi:hypothetical protein ACFOTA_06715 [Chitinophaga sp. GCM10012297]|uniref:Uncharacterized protein n=1 Tax=Chitinophaga chungangae TaxID=2821488 RepID=A0ABS3YB36_9BACT|nr:hypothetical protein [Chitinophaga chungangae]MBO9151892.1 hypothetical protein [Chitinophaga chungangae]